MTNYTVANVDEFIADSPKESQPHLKEIRAAVKAAIPQAEEKIGYGKPYYKDGRWLVGFDVYKQHIGFEIWESQLSSEIRKSLEEKGYKTGNKTFQIRYDQKVPVSMIKQIIKAQVKVAEEKSKKK
ncbi:MAG: uncharacterized protein QG639_1061 [Patescibacteria group bacterium]|jgi:uncharacterized protein YdhG (YjbR/CyaY superfamily)|nr:uncharacterized protein [Patescibacteria group bacterium]